MRNFDKLATIPDWAIASYQFHVNHTGLHVTLSQPKGLRSFQSVKDGYIVYHRVGGMASHLGGWKQLH